jgi:hypothetical protein
MNSTNIFHDKTTFEVMVRVKASSSVINRKNKQSLTIKSKHLAQRIEIWDGNSFSFFL